MDLVIIIVMGNLEPFRLRMPSSNPTFEACHSIILCKKLSRRSIHDITRVQHHVPISGTQNQYHILNGMMSNKLHCIWSFDFIHCLNFLTICIALREKNE